MNVLIKNWRKIDHFFGYVVLLIIPFVGLWFFENIDILSMEYETAKKYHSYIYTSYLIC